MRLRTMLVPLASAILARPTSARGQAAAEGWTIGIRLTRDLSGAPRPGTTEMHEWISDRWLRLEVDRAGVPPMLIGNYMLLGSGDSMVTMVTPSERRATTSVLRLPPITIKVISRSLKSTTTDLGAGEPILGHATHRYRRVLRGTVVESIYGRTCTIPLDREVEYWIAPDVTISAAMMAPLRHLQPAIADELTRNRSLVRDTLPHGAVLREVSRDRLRDGPGRTRVDERAMEFTELARGPIPDSIFDVPPGYTRITVSGVAHARVSATADSMMRAAGARLAARICAGDG